MSADRDLVERFQVQRTADAAQAPAFAATIGAARLRRTPVVTRVLVWSAAAAAVLAFGVTIARFADRPAPAPEVVQSISTWTSPTDALLRAPSGPLASAVPTLSSVLDDAIPKPVLLSRGNP